MTCIAGIAQDGKVWIGGDSAGVAGWSMTVRADEKVFVNGGVAFGFTGSFRMGDLLRFAFTPPEHSPKLGDRQYLCTVFMDAVRTCLKTGGLAKVENGVEQNDGAFLLGYRGKLYEICRDFQVGENSCAYGAVGCAGDIALGSLFQTHVGDIDVTPFGAQDQVFAKGRAAAPERRIRQALEAAAFHSAGVVGPFKVVSV